MSLETPSQPPPPQYTYTPPPRSGVPIWAWLLIGCGGVGCLSFVVLAAILLPVFAQAREKARAVSCMSNVKQSSLGMVMYMQDYDETFPHSPAWHTAIYSYTKNEVILHCPSVSKGSVTADAPYGYAFNSGLLDKSLAKVGDAKTTLMIFESSNLSKNAVDNGGSLPSPGRHLGVNTMGYVDGHVTGGNRRSPGSISYESP